MLPYAQTRDVLHSIVPVSRFNNGEASQIFDEVKQVGMRVVVTNNIPTCVILSIEKFEDIVEEMEDLHLSMEATKRLVEDNYISHEEMLNRLGFCDADVEDVPECWP